MLTQIIKTNGISGLFRGLTPTLFTVPTFWGVYFPIYEMSKTRISQTFMSQSKDFNASNSSTTNNALTVLTHVSSAVFAGALADCATNPMWVVRTRMQTETIHRYEFLAAQTKLTSTPNPMVLPQLLNIRQTINSVYAEGGVPAFYRGLSASLLGLSHVAIQFPVYEAMKTNFRLHSFRDRDGDRERTSTSTSTSTSIGPAAPIDWVCASATSKVIASCITYPHEVVRARMMDIRCLSKPGGIGLVKMTRTIYKQDGLRGFYKGMHVSLLRVIPNCVLTFVSYELFMKTAQDLLKVEK